MAVRELRQIAPCERRLLMRNGIERKGGIGDDPVAILAGDLPVLFQPVGLKSFAGHPRRRRADLVLGLQLEPHLLEGAMVDPCRDPQLGHALVGVGCPGLAPMGEQFGTVPVPYFRPEAILVHRARGQHDVSMGLGFAVRSDVPMHIQIGDHAAGDELAFD